MAIQFLRGTKSAITAENPVLLAGQPCVETDTGQMKIGNGSTAYNSLPYVGSSNFTLLYGSSSTAAATAAKVVTISGYKLITGAVALIEFTATNTASNPTLNISSTGAKAIYYGGSAVSASYLKAQHLYLIRYNGTQYDIIGDIDTNTDTKYGVVSTTANGLAPKLPGNTTTFLRGDGTYATPPNTDTKATQTNTTTNASYRLALSANANDTTETNSLRKSTNFQANPSTGEFYAKGYRRIDITGDTLDLNTLNLQNGYPMIMYYREATSGGAANITNVPREDQPFILDVELIRWASTSDYITKQTFVSSNGAVYTRLCTSGTWGAWSSAQVYTDNKVLNTLNNTAKAYLTGTTSGSTNTGTQIFDNGVYLDTTAGRLRVTSLNIGGGAILSYDSTNDAIKITF